MPSDNYAMWHLEMEQEFMVNKRKWGIPVNPITECRIYILITFMDNKKADLTNKAESIMDLLVDLGVIKDDNHFNCYEVNIVSGGVNKDKAGAEVLIYPLSRVSHLFGDLKD